MLLLWKLQQLMLPLLPEGHILVTLLECVSMVEAKYRHIHIYGSDSAIHIKIKKCLHSQL